MALSKPVEKSFAAIEALIATHLPAHVTDRYSGYVSEQEDKLRKARIELGKIKELLTKLEKDNG